MIETICPVICTLCGDDLPGRPASASATFCDACAWAFILDPEQYNASNNAPVLDGDALQDALNVAYEIVADLTWECLDGDDATGEPHRFALEGTRRQLFHEGQPVLCPECGAGAMPGPSDD